MLRNNRWFLPICLLVLSFGHLLFWVPSTEKKQHLVPKDTKPLEQNCIFCWFTKSSIILTDSATGKTLMASLQGCYVHKCCRQHDNLPVMWQIQFSLILCGLVTIKQSLRSDRAQSCSERSSRLTYCPFPSLPPALWAAALHLIR